MCYIAAMNTKRPPYLSEDKFREEIESWNGSIDDWGRSTEKKCYEIARDHYEAARAKDAEEIAKLKAIIKGVHGALNDLGNIPVPAMDADLYDAVISIRAKDAERINELEEVILGIVVAADSKMASYGDMWWACEVRDPVERARAIINKLSRHK